MTFINEVEVRKAINAIKGDDRVFEIRIISQRSKFPYSGYFKSADKAVECLKKQDLQDSNVYIVLNAIDEACYSRAQRDKLISGKLASTSDNDIEAREWILIDIDPVRPKDTSSTQEQIDKALAKCGKVHNFLLEQGFPRPIIGFSGNGYHLLYKLKMQNNKENADLLKNFLVALDELFSDDEMKIDQVNFNASRVCKLYGTLAQKGLNTEERPHRMSKIIKMPEVITPVDSMYIKRICGLVKAEQVNPSRYNNYSSENFDIEEWMQKYGISYIAYSYGSGTKYCLEHCPFDHNHTGKDAAIFKRSNGAIAFKCLHNSCADKTWKDVRMLFEPDAYERKRQQEERQIFNSYNRDAKPEPVHIEQKEGEPIFFTAKQILARPKQKEQIIKTGIYEFDKKYRGLRKKDVTALSGQAGSAKSTILSQIILNAIDAGNNVAVFSGELAEDDYMRWMYQQGAGRSYVEPTMWEGYYDVPYKYQEKIADWLEGKFWLYNNQYGFDFEAIIEQFDKMVDRHKLDMLCIDNLMALDISRLSKEKYEAQSRFAWQLHEFAQRKNIHIIIVCHPKKPMGLLGMYDISGTSDIVNAMDNIIFVYRRNQTFDNSYNQFFGVNWTGTGGTNIWHCAKARFGSVDDSYNELFYEKETKRLKNDVDEVHNYGWIDMANAKAPQQEEMKLEKDSGFRDAEEDDDLPWG